MIGDSLPLSHHGLGFPLCDEIRHDPALVLADVHEVLLCPSILVNGSEDFLGVAAQLVDVGTGVDKVQQLDLAAVVEEDCGFLGCICLLLVELRHAVDLKLFHRVMNTTNSIIAAYARAGRL